jgi:hypothetical protein
MARNHKQIKINNMKNKTQEQQIAQLKNQLSQVLDAYSILEEYCCELVDDVEENETLTYANSIVTIALNIDNK